MVELHIVFDGMPLIPILQLVICSIIVLAIGQTIKAIFEIKRKYPES
jgi:hypothetical protein